MANFYPPGYKISAFKLAPSLLFKSTRGDIELKNSVKIKIKLIAVIGCIALSACGKPAETVNNLDANANPSNPHLEPHTPVLQGSTAVLDIQQKSLNILSTDLDSSNDCFITSDANTKKLTISIGNKSQQGTIDISLPVDKLTDGTQTLELTESSGATGKFQDSENSSFEIQNSLGTSQASCQLKIELQDSQLNGYFGCVDLYGYSGSTQVSSGNTAKGSFSCKLYYSALK